MYVAAYVCICHVITYIPGFGGNAFVTPSDVCTEFREAFQVFIRNRTRRRFQHGAIEFRLGCSLFLFANSGLKEKRAPETKPSNNNNPVTITTATVVLGRESPRPVAESPSAGRHMLRQGERSSAMAGCYPGSPH